MDAALRQRFDGLASMFTFGSVLWQHTILIVKANRDSRSRKVEFCASSIFYSGRSGEVAQNPVFLRQLTISTIAGHFR